MPAEDTITNFLDALGSAAPAPGGGAACALAGALAAACAEMVGRFTVGRPKFQAVEDSMRAAVDALVAARADLLALIGEDARAFAAVSAAYKLPKATSDEQATREDAIQAALGNAMRPPLRVMERACDALEVASELAAAGNPTVASDAGCAALLGEAAVRAAGLNVLANIVLLRDADAASAARAKMAALEERAAALRERTMAAVHIRMGV